MRYELVVRQAGVLDIDVDALLIPTTRDLVVDGEFGAALARAGGTEFVEACGKTAPVELGDAAITTAGNLGALIVVHAACISLGQTSKLLVRGAYTRGFELAERSGIKVVATPPLAIAATGMTMAETTAMLIRLMKLALSKGSVVEKVIFAVPDLKTFEAYTAICQDEAGPAGESTDRARSYSV